jgi:hypothetical protein
MRDNIFNGASKLIEIHLEWTTPPTVGTGTNLIHANAFASIGATPPTTFYVENQAIAK